MRSQGPPKSLTNGCRGKVRYLAESDGLRAVERMRRDCRYRGPGLALLRVYACVHCGFFHVGRVRH